VGFADELALELGSVSDEVAKPVWTEVEAVLLAVVAVALEVLAAAIPRVVVLPYTLVDGNTNQAVAED